jgi:hypothetical protein
MRNGCFGVVLHLKRHMTQRGECRPLHRSTRPLLVDVVVLAIVFLATIEVANIALDTPQLAKSQYGIWRLQQTHKGKS